MDILGTFQYFEKLQRNQLCNEYSIGILADGCENSMNSANFRNSRRSTGYALESIFLRANIGT